MALFSLGEMIYRTFSLRLNRIEMCTARIIFCHWHGVRNWINKEPFTRTVLIEDSYFGIYCNVPQLCVCLKHSLLLSRESERDSVSITSHIIEHLLVWILC